MMTFFLLCVWVNSRVSLLLPAVISVVLYSLLLSSLLRLSSVDRSVTLSSPQQLTDIYTNWRGRKEGYRGREERWKGGGDWEDWGEGGSEATERRKDNVMRCWLIWGQNIHFHTHTCVSVSVWVSSVRRLNIQPVATYLCLICKNILGYACLIQSHVIKLTFGSSMAGKAGPRWIPLPPEEPVSPFIWAGGHSVTQAANNGCHYERSRLHVNW